MLMGMQSLFMSIDTIDRQNSKLWQNKASHLHQPPCLIKKSQTIKVNFNTKSVSDKVSLDYFTLDTDGVAQIALNQETENCCTYSGVWY